jgi:hypothetical protein
MKNDLISRSALLEKAEYTDNYRLIVPVDCIQKAPAVDAVEVVRCKDCKHRGDDLCCPMCFEEEYEIDEGDGYFDTDYITHDRTVDDGFCDRGERRNDECI